MSNETYEGWNPQKLIDAIEEVLPGSCGVTRSCPDEDLELCIGRRKHCREVVNAFIERVEKVYEESRNHTSGPYGQAA